MVTYKFKYTSDNQDEIISFLNEGNNIFRCAFKLFQKGFDRSLVEKKLKEYNFDFDLMDFTIRRNICQDADGFFKSYETRNQKTLIFGGRSNYKKYLKGLISKEEWLKKRNNKGVLFVGSAQEKLGNRKVKINVEENTITFKINRTTHFKCKVDFFKRRNDLFKIQTLTESKSVPITYRLDDKHIYISFDESHLKTKEHEYVKDRIAGLDLNPNYIGFVISDKEEVIYKEVINLTSLNKTHNKNKKDYEVVQISKRLSEICKHYKVEMVGYEDLTMTSKDHKKGKKINRLINNSWNRDLFVNNFKKRLNILGIKNRHVPPHYSSTIGCLNNPDETDSIAAAIEIGRRCYYFKKKYLDKDKEFLDADVIFPPFDRKKIMERWNSILSDFASNKMGYKSIHEHLKKQKKLILLRFLFKDYDFSSWSCFRIKSRKSLTTGYSVI